jgi:small subunit ribosomal protein S7
MTKQIFTRDLSHDVLCRQNFGSVTIFLDSSSASKVICGTERDFLLATRTIQTMPAPSGLRSSFRALSIRLRPLNQCLASRTAAPTRGFASHVNSSHAELTGDSSNSRPNVPLTRPAADAGVVQSMESPNQAAVNQLELVSHGLNGTAGNKFGIPQLPLPSKMHMKHRYDPVIAQITRLLMRDGKLGKAQRVS